MMLWMSVLDGVAVVDVLTIVVVMVVVILGDDDEEDDAFAVASVYRSVSLSIQQCHVTVVPYMESVEQSDCYDSKCILECVLEMVAISLANVWDRRHNYRYVHGSWWDHVIE